MLLALMVLGIVMTFVGAFLELFAVSIRSKPRLQLRKGDIPAYLSGSAFAIAGVALTITTIIIALRQ